MTYVFVTFLHRTTGDTFCVYFLFDMDLMVMLMRQGLHVLFIYDLCALFADMHMVACSWIHHTWYDLIYVISYIDHVWLYMY